MMTVITELPPSAALLAAAVVVVDFVCLIMAMTTSNAIIVVTKHTTILIIATRNVNIRKIIDGIVVSCHDLLLFLLFFRRLECRNNGNGGGFTCFCFST